MSKQRQSAAARVFVWLWYLPIIITLGAGVLLSLHADIPANIVDKARVFQEGKTASRTLTPLVDKSYKLSVELDQTFAATGEGIALTGDFRAGDKLRLPLTLTGERNTVISLARVELTDGSSAPPIKGFTLTVRSCESPWLKTANVYACSGPNKIKLATTPIVGDTLGIFDEGETLKQNEAQHLLLEIDVEPDIILPVKGYSTPLRVEVTALKTKVP